MVNQSDHFEQLFSSPLVKEVAEEFLNLLDNSLSHAMRNRHDRLTPKAILENLIKQWREQPVQMDAAQLIKLQMDFMENQRQLWQQVGQAFFKKQTLSQFTDEGERDPRFQDSDWNTEPVFYFLKQAYLLNAKMLEDLVEQFEFKDPQFKQQTKFFTRQFVSALSPANFAYSNPEVCREILKSKGSNLLKGMENLVRDLKQSPADALNILQTDLEAFELGTNLAATPGEVIYQNDLMQLIQYTPDTKKCLQRPLLFVPPFINKYYILDLDHKKSMVHWLVKQGFTVFMISWVNPSAQMADKQFDDYMLQGPVAALDAVEAITGENKINTAGYCVGGMLLATTQSYLQNIGDERINSMTFFTTLLDYDEPGEIGNFISEQILSHLEKETGTHGVLDGRILGMSFSFLRENNLYWPFYINNYLKGETPSAFDILYWNSDATNLPANTFNFYIRNAYLNNCFVEAGSVILNEVPINLSTINLPTYFVAPKADHIVLWESAYQSARRLGDGISRQAAMKRFILAGSGHIAGIINPAESGKYPYWACDSSVGNEGLPEDPHAWLNEATKVEGSWWCDWYHWLAGLSGDKVDAQKVGIHPDFPALEPAPGSYVKVRI